MMVEYAKLMKEWDNIGVWKTDVLNNTASQTVMITDIGRVAQSSTTHRPGQIFAETPSNTIYR